MKKKYVVWLTAAVLTAQVGCLSAFGAENGWVQNGGNWYYYDYNGAALTDQAKTINSQKYFFDANGVMLHDAWWQSRADGKWYYAGGDGAAVKGWLQLGTDWYYLQASGAMAGEGWHTIDGKRYYFNENGTMRKNGYVREKYLDSNGANDSRYDIKVRGKIDKEILEEAGEKTVNIPGWLLNHIFESDWKIACNAEKDNYGTLTHEEYSDYVRYFDLETSRKLIFFTQPDYICQGIGLYVNNKFGNPANSEDFQGAYNVDYSMVISLMEQEPMLERSKDAVFAEVFALYYNSDDDLRQDFREYCPSLCEYMDRFMGECYGKAQAK